MSKLKKAHTQSWATWVVAIFVFLAVVLGLSIAYFSFAKTTVIVTPEPQSFIAQVSVPLNQVDGQLFTSEKEGTLTYNQITAQKEEPDYAVGTVTIKNETGSDQPLVATTRLLSDGGILFRTQDRVVVPARGQIEVAVKADQIGETGNIDPTHFTIVALHEGQQAKIYANSSTQMTGGLKKTGVLTVTDIKAAQTQLTKDLVKTAVADLISQAATAGQPTDNISTDTVIVERKNETQSAQTGDTVNSVTVGLTVQVTGFTYNVTTLTTLVENTAQTQTPEGTTLADLEGHSQYQFTLPTEPTPPDQPVKILVSVKGHSILGLSSPLLDRTKIINKDEQDIITYFSNFEEVKSVSVQFRPFWIKRAPALTDHILIQIAQPSSTNTTL